MKESYNNMYPGNHSQAIAIEATVPELTYILGRPVKWGKNFEWAKKTGGGGEFTVDGEPGFSLYDEQNRYQQVRWNIKSGSLGVSMQAKREIEKALGSKKSKLLYLRDKYSYVIIHVCILLFIVISILPGTSAEKEAYHFYAFLTTCFLCFITSALHKIVHFARGRK